MSGRSKRSDADQLRAVQVPMVSQPSQTAAGGKVTYHTIRPTAWPDCVIEVKDFKGQVKAIAKTLKKAGVGKVKLFLKGRTEENRRIISIGVEPKGGRPIGVCVFDQPPDVEGEELMKTDVGPIIAIRFLEPSRYSPVAIYSVHPIPDVMQRYAQNSPEVLFECIAALLVMSGEGFDPDRNANIAAELVEACFGEVLDSTPESLKAVDRLCKRLHWREDTPPLPTTVMLLGGYVGEVFRKSFGGNWTNRGGGYPVLTMGDIPQKEITNFEVNPIGKVHKLIQDGEGDETSFLFESTRTLMY